MVKLTKQQEKAMEHCRRIVANTKKAMELIKSCPIKHGMVYANIGYNKGTIEAVFTPLSYNMTAMQVFIHACSIRMFGNNKILYAYLNDFKKWEPTMSPLTINWLTLSTEFKKRTYGIQEAL